MEIASLADIQSLFHERIIQMVWCNMATLDAQNRLRSRIVQPIWDGMRGWIATRQSSPKAAHIAHNPFVSLAYIGDNIRPVYIDGTVAWADDLATKEMVWELSRSAPEPLRYDFTPIYHSPDNPAFGVLALTPWRIELADMFGQPMVWHHPAQGN